jgi:hypothetical protein
MRIPEKVLTSKYRFRFFMILRVLLYFLSGGWRAFAIASAFVYEQGG